MSKLGVNSDQSMISHALIINAHGRKTDRKFNLGSNTIVTPGNLNEPYVFKVDLNWNMEKHFRAGIIKPVNNGNWTTYHQSASSQMPDMDLYPWKMGEVRHFAKRVVGDLSMWSAIDDKKGLYFDRDPHAKLVIKVNNQYIYLDGKEATVYFRQMNHCNDAEYLMFLQNKGVPLFMFAPQVGKIKILEKTSLSEVLNCVNKMDGNKLFMVAACNAVKDKNKTITYEHNGPDISVSQTLNLNTSKQNMNIPAAFVQVQFLLNALAKYNNIQKEKGWHRVGDWEIGRSGHSGNVALANSHYQFELEGGKLKCIDKTNGYAKVEPLPSVSLPQEAITAFIQNGGSKAVKQSVPVVNNAASVSPQQSFKLKQEEFLLNALTKYNKVQKEKKWHKVGDWEIGRSGYSGNIALANSQYQFELEGGKLKCMDKTNGFAKVEPLPSVLLPQQEIAQFIQAQAKVIDKDILHQVTTKKGWK